MKKDVLVVFGGASFEYKVSLESAYYVIKSINKDKYNVHLLGIKKNGNCYLYEGDVNLIKDDRWFDDETCYKVFLPMAKDAKGINYIKEDKVYFRHIDIVFPVLHGKNGEDGTIQGLLEFTGIPFVGCGVLSSSLCMDKYRAHKLVEAFGCKVPSSILIDDIKDRDKILKFVDDIGFPVFVKPLKSGSSFGITKVISKERLYKALKEAFRYDDKVVIEENIDGFEVGIAMLGNKKIVTGLIDEIETGGKFFDYNEKYTLEKSIIHLPARINNELKKEVLALAEKIYKILDCKDFARVDMFIDKNNNIYFNEINTIPGFTLHSRYPNMLKGVGINFDEIVNTLIEMGGGDETIY